MASKSLKQKAATGMVWSALQRYSTIIIQFISGIILARLLTPYDYGCIGMLTIFMTLSEAFIDGGFGSALIQKKNPTQEDYSTIFFWNLGMSVILYAVVFLSAPKIAAFYDIPLLSNVLRVQGAILFIYAFNIVQRNQLQKKLNFKLLSIVTITTSIISLTVTIIMAYHGFGVWSLVAQHILTSLIPSLFFWFYIKWRPAWVFSWKSFKSLFSFGFYMFLSDMMNRLSMQIQGLLIGKVYNADTMGYYSKAYSTERLASTNVASVMTQVSYPLFAEVQDDKEKLINIIKRLTMTLSYITFPLLFILLLCAKPIFVLLYSDRWIESVPYFQVLCIAGLASCLHSVNYRAVAAVGKSRVMFTWTIIKRMVGLIFIVLGLFLYGMKGLLIGMVLNSWFSYFVNIWQVSKYIGYRWWRQLLDILPVAVVSVVAAIVSYFTTSFFHFTLYVDGLVKFFIVVVIYMGWSLVSRPESFKYTESVISSLRKNKGYKKKQ